MTILLRQAPIKKTAQIASKRREVALRISEGLAGIPCIKWNKQTEGGLPSHWFLRMLFDKNFTTVDKYDFCAALSAEGLPVNAYYAATPFTGDWYTKRNVFGSSGYPWAAPEYKGNRNKYYTLEDVPNAAKALDDTIMLYLNESWSDTNIAQVSGAFYKVYEAYKI